MAKTNRISQYIFKITLIKRIMYGSSVKHIFRTLVKNNHIQQTHSNLKYFVKVFTVQSLLAVATEIREIMAQLPYK